MICLFQNVYFVEVSSYEDNPNVPNFISRGKKKRSLKRKWRFLRMEIYVIAINWGYYTRFLMIEIYVIYFPFSNWMFLIKDRDTWDWNPNIQRSFRNKLQYLVFMLNYNEMMIVINKKIFNNNSYSMTSIFKRWVSNKGGAKCYSRWSHDHLDLNLKKKNNF